MKKRLGMNHGVVYKQHQALSMTLFADFYGCVSSSFAAYSPHTELRLH